MLENLAESNVIGRDFNLTGNDRIEGSKCTESGRLENTLSNTRNLTDTTLGPFETLECNKVTRDNY
jgi:hypothetical protein